ncbi:Cth [Columba guinea]|nr:Cth [Columba guinea]
MANQGAAPCPQRVRNGNEVSEGVCGKQGYEYSRSGNPTRNCLEKAVAMLDGAKYCLAYASGLAATLNITHLLKAGDMIICMDDVYGGTNRYFRKVAMKMGLNVVFVDCAKIECLEAAITPETKLVWIETPTNPMLKIIDIQACADVVHKHKDVLLVVDNTFMSAYFQPVWIACNEPECTKALIGLIIFISFQRPLSLGADICMYSATKYMNGHSDVVMGLVSVNCDDLYERLKFLQNALGAVPSPFDCYLCSRGLKTLQIRMKQHFHNALAVARFLESNPRVQKVIFPGLPSHPQHELVKRQCTGCPGMVTFYIKGNLENAATFLKNLKVFALAESLGGYESLAEHPAIMTHSSVPEEDREALGISDTLIRLSVGLEDEEDLLEDLDQALKAAICRLAPAVATDRDTLKYKDASEWCQRNGEWQLGILWIYGFSGVKGFNASRTDALVPWLSGGQMNVKGIISLAHMEKSRTGSVPATSHVFCSQASFRNHHAPFCGDMFCPTALGVRLGRSILGVAAVSASTSPTGTIRDTAQVAKFTEDDVHADSLVSADVLNTKENVSK